VPKEGLQTSPKVSRRLISLGRDLASSDLLLPDRIFSKNHRHFYFKRSSSALILRDTFSRCLELDDGSISKFRG